MENYMCWVGPNDRIGVWPMRQKMQSGIWDLVNFIGAKQAQIALLEGKGALATPTAEQVQPAINYGQVRARHWLFPSIFSVI